MAIRPIVKYPDPVLLRPTRRVAEVTAEIRALVADMWETMYNAPGVGLAANQIGVDLRVAVIDTTSSDEPEMRKLVLINPEVVETSGKLTEEEGCLSVPGFTEVATRPARTTVRALALDGKSFTVEGSGLLSRALMHETDHLDGKVFLDRLSALKRDLIRRKIRKLEKNGEWPDPHGGR